MADQTVYTLGGTIRVGQSTYIRRIADDELLRLCRNGDLAFVLSPRQIGKSSLMVSTSFELRKENIQSAVIDLSAIGVGLSMDQWYLGILDALASALKLETDIESWWSEHDQYGPSQRLIDFFREILLRDVKEKVVIFFDEIDSTLSLSFSSDDFFAALRAVYNARSITPDFQRLSFVLLGVATPSELIKDSNRTPFNIGQGVELKDFNKDEIKPLIQGLGDQSGQILEWIYNATNGHPYLTQRLCNQLALSSEPVNEKVIERAVKDLFTGEQAQHDNNLKFVNEMLLKRSPDSRKVLAVYKDIYSGKPVRDDEHSMPKVYLKLSGLVSSERGFLRVRNEIYNTVFDSRWITENTPKNIIRVVTPILAGISLLFLAIIFYNFVVLPIRENYYAGKFIIAESSSENLKYLSNLFSLHGFLFKIDYASQARRLYFDANWDKQIRIFQDSSITSADKQRYLPIVVEGLYVTMANVSGEEGQDSTEILGIIKDSLNNLTDPEISNLQNEINLWLEARNAATDQDALDKYNQAINLNSNNPATHYERALVEIRLEDYEKALLDLEATIGLAHNLFEENNPNSIESVSQSGRNYRSKFYKMGYVQDAVNNVIQENLQDTNFTTALILAKTQINKYTNLESAGLLGKVDELAGKFATQISMAQTQISEVQDQKSTVEAQSTDAQYQILTATAQYSKAQIQVTAARAEVSTAQALIASGIVNTVSRCRSGTGPGFPNVAVIPQGESIEVLGRNGENDWLWVIWIDEVTNKKYECWISADLVNFDPTPVPTVFTPTLPIPTIDLTNAPRFKVSAPSSVTCQSGQQCNIHVEVLNAPAGNICVYVQPHETANQPYYFQFPGTSGTATIGAAPDNTPFVIFAVASSSCPGGQQSVLPPGTSARPATVIRHNS